jgi:hypothetical protein
MRGMKKIEKEKWLEKKEKVEMCKKKGKEEKR